MNVNSYIFQSPYSSQVQIGRLASSASSDNSSSNTNQEVANTTVTKEVPTFENMDTQKAVKVQPTQNSSDASLDLYA